MTYSSINSHPVFASTNVSNTVQVSELNVNLNQILLIIKKTNTTITIVNPHFINIPLDTGHNLFTFTI